MTTTKAGSEKTSVGMAREKIKKLYAKIV